MGLISPLSLRTGIKGQSSYMYRSRSQRIDMCLEPKQRPKTTGSRPMNASQRGSQQRGSQQRGQRGSSGGGRNGHGGHRGSGRGSGRGSRKRDRGGQGNRKPSFEVRSRGLPFTMPPPQSRGGTANHSLVHSRDVLRGCDRDGDSPIRPHHHGHNHPGNAHHEPQYVRNSMVTVWFIRWVQSYTLSSLTASKLTQIDTHCTLLPPRVLYVFPSPL